MSLPAPASLSQWRSPVTTLLRCAGLPGFPVPVPSLNSSMPRILGYPWRLSPPRPGPLGSTRPCPHPRNASHSLLPFQISPPRRPPPQTVTRYARRTSSFQSERAVRRRVGSHGLPQLRAAEAGGLDAGGRRRRRRGEAAVRRGGGRGGGAADAEEGSGRAEGPRVHGQGTHQPHASLRRREAELHLPRGHPVRAAPSSPPSSLPPFYLLRT
jgi:hypothetical protein